MENLVDRLLFFEIINNRQMEKIRKDAIEVIHRYYEVFPYSGVRPSTVGSVSLYLSCKYSGVKISQMEFCKVTKTAKAGFRNTYTMVRDRLV